MKTIKYAAILVGSIFVLNSCTKDVAGPAGPMGPQGAQGASASYSVTIDSIPASAWPSSPNANGAYTVTLNNVKALTNPNYNIVEVYAATIYSPFSTWQELPTTNVFTMGDALNFSFTTYQVTVEYTASSAPTQPLFIKVVIINQP